MGRVGEEQNPLRRIGNKEELSYPDDDVTLSHLRVSGLILIVVLEGAQPWEKSVSLTEKGLALTACPSCAAGDGDADAAAAGTGRRFGGGSAS